MTKTQVLIKAAGGNRAISARVGVECATVWRWGKSDKIPERHLQSICDMTEGLINPEQLTCVSKK